MTDMAGAVVHLVCVIITTVYENRCDSPLNGKNNRERIIPKTVFLICLLHLSLSFKSPPCGYFMTLMADESNQVKISGKSSDLYYF